MTSKMIEEDPTIEIAGITDDLTDKLQLDLGDITESSSEKETSKINEAIHAEFHSVERASKMPFIDHLKNAVTQDKEGNLVFNRKCHEQIVIERTVTIGDQAMWLDTRVYEVREIDKKTGNVSLFDLGTRQSAQTNYIMGIERGYRFKIPKKKQRLSRKRPTEKKVKTKQEKKTKKSGGVRRIYDTRGIIHTRLKGLAFVPSNSEGDSETRAKAGDRLQVTPGPKETVTITHPEDGWTETWHLQDGM